MTINYGKRFGGDFAAQAAGNQSGNEGDTLYIPFAAFNDSGDNEAITGFTAADINVYKNGGVTQRATDSGYSLISDTGMLGDVVGMYRVQLDIFNTTDDTGFYDAGSQYHVGIVQVTIDGKTVKFYPAVFELEGVRSGGPNRGRPQVDVVAIAGDTGAAHLSGGRLGTGVTDTGIANAVWSEQHSAHTGDTGSLGYGVNIHYISQDTGIAEHLGSFAVNINTAGQLNSANYEPGFNIPADVQAVDGDTGAADRLGKFAGIKLTDSGTLDTGSGTPGGAAATLDTGVVNQAVWQADASRVLTAFPHDTGVANTVWKESSSTYTGDTGSVGYAQGRLMAVKGDTGAVHLDQGRLGVVSDSGKQAAVLDTGKVAAAVWTSHAARTVLDTGISAAVWAQATRSLTTFPHDTGISDTVWKAQASGYDTDTGSLAYAVGNVLKVRGDTGIADRLFKSLGVIAKFRASDTGTGQTTTSINSNLTEATADHYNGRVIIWTSGVLKDEATDISDYAAGTFTVTAMTEAASAGDSGIIV